MVRTMSMEPMEPVITVIWMDGQRREYDHVNRHYVAEGMLTIEQFTSREQFDSIKTLHLPLANIREIVVESRPTP